MVRIPKIESRSRVSTDVSALPLDTRNAGMVYDAIAKTSAQAGRMFHEIGRKQKVLEQDNTARELSSEYMAEYQAKSLAPRDPNQSTKDYVDGMKQFANDKYDELVDSTSDDIAAAKFKNRVANFKMKTMLGLDSYLVEAETAKGYEQTREAANSAFKNQILAPDPKQAADALDTAAVDLISLGGSAEDNKKIMNGLEAEATKAVVEGFINTNDFESAKMFVMGKMPGGEFAVDMESRQAIKYLREIESREKAAGREGVTQSRKAIANFQTILNSGNQPTEKDRAELVLAKGSLAGTDQEKVLSATIDNALEIADVLQVMKTQTPGEMNELVSSRNLSEESLELKALDVRTQGSLNNAMVQNLKQREDDGYSYSKKIWPTASNTELLNKQRALGINNLMIMSKSSANNAAAKLSSLENPRDKASLMEIEIFSKYTDNSHIAMANIIKEGGLPESYKLVAFFPGTEARAKMIQSIDMKKKDFSATSIQTLLAKKALLPYMKTRTFIKNPELRNQIIRAVLVDASMKGEDALTMGDISNSAKTLMDKHFHVMDIGDTRSLLIPRQYAVKGPKGRVKWVQRDTDSIAEFIRMSRAPSFMAHVLESKGFDYSSTQEALETGTTIDSNLAYARLYQGDLSWQDSNNLDSVTLMRGDNQMHAVNKNILNIEYNNMLQLISTFKETLPKEQVIYHTMEWGQLWGMQ